MSVANRTMKHYAKINTLQPSLWDAPRELPEHGLPLEAFPLDCILPFRWADGDTSEAATARMLAQVNGQSRYLYGGNFVNHRMVSYYVSVAETWIEDGVVWGECRLWPEGRYVDELRRGNLENEEEEDNE